jgi:hypothetical protein
LLVISSRENLFADSRPLTTDSSGIVFQTIVGGVAQLGEHLLCKQGVIGSIPFTSTKNGAEVQESRSETFALLAVAEGGIVL